MSAVDQSGTAGRESIHSGVEVCRTEGCGYREYPPAVTQEIRVVVIPVLLLSVTTCAD